VIYDLASIAIGPDRSCIAHFTSCPTSAVSGTLASLRSRLHSTERNTLPQPVALVFTSLALDNNGCCHRPLTALCPSALDLDLLVEGHYSTAHYHKNHASPATSLSQVLANSDFSRRSFDSNTVTNATIVPGARHITHIRASA